MALDGTFVTSAHDSGAAGCSQVSGIALVVDETASQLQSELSVCCQPWQCLQICMGWALAASN
jgi:hypothetical protein